MIKENFQLSNRTPWKAIPAIVTVVVGLKQRLNINAELTGDLFPNGEVLLLDQAGTVRMLQSYETDGGQNTGPVRLFRKGNESMNGICMSYPLDGAGNFV
jgi:hypothetical protein